MRLWSRIFDIVDFARPNVHVAVNSGDHTHGHVFSFLVSPVCFIPCVPIRTGFSAILVRVQRGIPLDFACHKF